MECLQFIPLKGDKNLMGICLKRPKSFNYKKPNKKFLIKTEMIQLPYKIIFNKHSPFVPRSLTPL